MPTYTYRCNNCEYQFDIKQRMADEPLKDCPECNSDNALRKVLNSVGIVFKGSGFYVTDTRGTNGAAASTPSSNNKDGENGASTKSEPAAKENGSKTEATSSKESLPKEKTEKTADTKA